MRTLEQRIVKLEAEVPARGTEYPKPGDTVSTVHFCLEKTDGTLLLIEHGMPPFIPPADDSTIICIRLKSKGRVL